MKEYRPEQYKPIRDNAATAAKKIEQIQKSFERGIINETERDELIEAVRNNIR